MYPSWPKRDGCRTAGADHMRPLWSPEKFQALVDVCAITLQDHAHLIHFDAIAGCGISGMPLLGALSYRLGIPMIAVRKPGEKAHSPSSAQGMMFGSRYVIVDDLIESGATIDHIIKCVMQGHSDITMWGATDSKDPIDVNISLPECVGIMLYSSKEIKHPDDLTRIEYNGIPIIQVHNFFD